MKLPMSATHYPARFYESIYRTIISFQKKYGYCFQRSQLVRSGSSHQKKYATSMLTIVLVLVGFTKFGRLLIAPTLDFVKKMSGKSLRALSLLTCNELHSFCMHNSHCTVVISNCFITLYNLLDVRKT